MHNQEDPYSQIKLVAVLNTAVDSIIIISKEGIIDYVNKSTESLFGYSLEELKGENINILMPSPYKDEHDDYLQNFLDTGISKIIGIGREVIARKKDGSIFPIHLSVSEFKIEEEVYFTGIIRDITRLKEAEQEALNLREHIMKTQKLESLGVLAGGIAHDFNNLLGGILLNISTAYEINKLNGNITSYLEEIEKITNQASELSKQLVTYTGSGFSKPSKKNVNELIEELKSLVKLSSTGEIKIEYQMEPNLPFISVDPSQFTQVIMNFVINAAESFINKSGKILISSGKTFLEQEEISKTLLRSAIRGDYVYVAVSDNGRGINKRIMEKIFDPFFSTKVSGRGLGLSTTLGIARTHKGTVSVISEEGVGSTFTIYFPISDFEDRSNLAPHNRTILICDDEEGMRNILVDIFEQKGFSVVEAKDGNEALEEFKKHKEIIDYVLLDYSMPRMNGLQVSKMIKEIQSDIPITLMSGFVERSIPSELKNNIDSFIQKPFTYKKITSVIEELRK